MDEDELPNSGLSGWAGFQLGQMFAEHRRSSAETVSTLLHGRRNASALQALQVQVQALAAENARLRHSLTEYKLNYEELLRWRCCTDRGWVAKTPNPICGHPTRTESGRPNSSIRFRT
jgi:hypothetical protein